MSDINQMDIIDNLRDINSTNTLLDMLIEFERQLDKSGIYAYENWKLGEVIKGPELSRYWLYVCLMYPYSKMPNPKGALRLTNRDFEVKFKKGYLSEVVDVKSPDDLDDEGNPKTVKKRIWLVDIWVPRRFIDEFTDDKTNVNGENVDMDELNGAYDDGLDDDSRIQTEQ